jgi:hypothetical protein
MPPDPDDVTALVVASVLTLLLFNMAGAVATWLLWRKARAVRAAQPQVAPERDAMAPLYYVLSLLLWPASLALCIAFLGSPRKARLGAVCGTLGVVQVMATAWLVCLTFAVFARELVPYLP